MTSKKYATQEIHVSPLLEVRRANGSDAGLIAGYASTWGGPPDSYGTMFAKGAFRDSIAEHQREKTAPIMLWAHNRDEPVGKWTEFREDDYGLTSKAV